MPPPGAGEWQADAVTWLLDQAPPEFRSYAVVRHHPLLLAWLVAHHVRAQQEALRAARSTARRDLSQELPPEVAPRLFDVLDREELRLRRLARAVDLLEQAVRGRRFVPRM
ncbi:conserved hypothetical protein [Kineococcus radiotolerans SRS30216 = ATCC BAA-149]|uniref:Restriction endonuclease subunit S n=1 Tax=Kineococcus radiotolerans (strain ATCC BAA-149 / DSM 14245 / SRS30216) TaxID=266940 RepID=A6W8C4_KINRD|nr:conserved hypothetical protein [Kineococcus radiotolerans SRS30216 = ATCC BAA-149]